MKGKIGELVEKSKRTLKDEGVKSLVVKGKNWTTFQVKKKYAKQEVKDILFINGCSIGYCERYRVHHKMEELMAFGVTCDEVNTGMLSDDLIARYRGFVIYRAPHDQRLEEFVKKAQSYNKVVFYDIDDLVFDLKYTAQIESLKKLPKAELDLYNDGVVRFGKMLDLCDYAITTTETIADEMKKRGKEVCIDKNIANLTMQKFSEMAIREVVRDKKQVVIGYASGSMTHNEDFEMIKPAVLRILREHPEVVLKLVGALELPEDLKALGDRVVTEPFVEYTKLPYIIRSFDINLAPLVDTLFNRAKSSIKWMEAGFVKVPTVASSVGDFQDSITDGKDGVLCGADSEEWFKALEKMVTDVRFREKIGEGAYRTVREKYVVTTRGKVVSDFIMGKLKRNVYFVLPGVDVSGGILVATRHAEILKKNGVDVTMINMNERTAGVREIGEGINVIPYRKVEFLQHIDEMVATMWLTLPEALKYPLCRDVRYLVQGREPDFYKFPDDNILKANATYNAEGVKYLTISKWCEGWLEEVFSREVRYAPNGIFASEFKFRERDFKGKIKILIEGSASSHYKNVDESFRIANRLDPEKFEVIYVTNRGKAKSWYRVDKLYMELPHEEMVKVYESADILIKSSLSEGFSYPPLEMMATGGLVVARPNEGNVEYLKDGENCLFYADEEEAVEKIKELVLDAGLREGLVAGGRKTAEMRDWGKIEKGVLKLYE